MLNIVLKCEKYKATIEGVIASGYFLEDDNICSSLIAHSELTARIFEEGLKSKPTPAESEYLDQVTFDADRVCLAHWVNYEPDQAEILPFSVELKTL